jgi:fucose 4-O-acetylase-like acetyltransferase
MRHQHLDFAAPRQQWIDVAKGLAILLVVLGHVILSAKHSGHLPGYGWQLIFFVIYTIHMPVFMFLAGFCARLRLAEPSRFGKKIVVNLLWPYVLWTSVLIASLSLATGVRATTQAAAPGIQLLWTPLAWLWFIPALSMFHALALLFRRHLWVLVGLGIAALPFDLHPISPFQQQLAHFLIFYAGGIALQRVPSTERLLLLGIAATSLSIAAWAFVSGNWASMDDYAYWTLPAFPASVLWVFFVVSSAKRVNMPKFVADLGQRSFGIYLTHIFFIVAVRIFFERGWGITNFVIVGPLSLIAGVAGPLILMRAVYATSLEWLIRLGYPAKRDASLASARQFATS